MISIVASIHLPTEKPQSTLPLPPKKLPLLQGTWRLSPSQSLHPDPFPCRHDPHVMNNKSALTVKGSPTSEIPQSAQTFRMFLLQWSYIPTPQAPHPRSLDGFAVQKTGSFIPCATLLGCDPTTLSGCDPTTHFYNPFLRRTNRLGSSLTAVKRTVFSISAPDSPLPPAPQNLHAQTGGSYPPGFHGWQRSIRRSACQEPRTIPRFSIASIAYWLQVGTKRHLGPKRGLIPRW